MWKNPDRVYLEALNADEKLDKRLADLAMLRKYLSFSGGEEIAITLDGKPFARLIPEKPQKAESDHPTEAPCNKLSK